MAMGAGSEMGARGCERVCVRGADGGVDCWRGASGDAVWMVDAYANSAAGGGRQRVGVDVVGRDNAVVREGVLLIGVSDGHVARSVCAVATRDCQAA